MSKHDDLQKILRWCNVHRGKDFYFHNVGVSSSAMRSLCSSSYKGMVWIVRKGKSVTKDSNNGLMRYGLAHWVDLDKV